MSPELSRALARWVAARDAVQGFTSRVTLDTAYEMRQAEAELDRLARAPPQGERARALADVLREVNAIKQRNALARDRADAAGREVVALCRQANVEGCEEIEDRVRALAASSPQDNEPEVKP